MSEKIKYYLDKAKSVIFPKATDDLVEEIDRINLRYVRIVSSITLAFEIVGLVLIGLSYIKLLDRRSSLLSVFFCICVCFVSLLISAFYSERKKVNHAMFSAYIAALMILLVLWGMDVSISHYVENGQVLTFYTVVFVFDVFLCHRPMYGIIFTLWSFMLMYFVMHYVNGAEGVQPFNYFTMMIIFAAGSVTRYNLVLNELKNKKVIKRLNESLEEDIKTEKNRVLEKELENSKMKINIMQNQISPHFVFNALSIIKSLLWEDRDKAEQSITDFSVYLRRNIESLRSTELIPFEKELEHIEAFLAIEKADETVDLTIEYDIEEKDFLIPPLSIEPVVENAVIHGISKLEHGALIKISSRCEQDRYIVSVIDNGRGFDNKTEANGVGLENVRTRLKYQCDGILEIENSKAGTVVRVIIPMGRKENEGIGG